jgi:hypothetical protein
LGKQGRRTAQLHLLFNPRATFAGKPAQLKAIPKGTIRIGAVQPEFLAIGCREHHAAGFEFFQKITQLCEGEEGKRGRG